MVKEEWESHGELKGNLWSRMKEMKAVVKKWHQKQYLFNKRWIHVCDVGLKNVMIGPMPTGHGEFESF